MPVKRDDKFDVSMDAGMTIFQQTSELPIHARSLTSRVRPECLAMSGDVPSSLTLQLVHF